MLPQTRIAQGWWLPAVNHICGELRGKSALKRMPPKTVPEHLLKDALVVTGEKYLGSPGLEKECESSKKDCGKNDVPIGENGLGRLVSQARHVVGDGEGEPQSPEDASLINN